MKQIFFLLLVLLCGLSLTLNAQQNCAVNIFLLENECGEARLFAYCPEPASENCYTWNTGGSNNAFLNITESGTYSCTAICSNGGEATGTLQITVAPPCNISLDITETKFCGKTKLQATEVAGANYMWSNGAMTSSVEVMNSATYTVTMTVGTSEFISSKNVEVMNFQAPPIIGNNKVCVGEKTTVTASGGVSYLWSNGMIGPTIQVGKGTYTVTVTGSNGCTASVNASVSEFSMSPAPGVFQSVNADGVITLTSTLPSGNLWSNGAVTQSITPPDFKLYTLKVKDQNGCFSLSSLPLVAGQKVKIEKEIVHVDTCMGQVIAVCPLSAGFSHEIDEVNLRKVYFRDLSSGEPEIYIWNFGDGGTGLFGNEKNPVHIFEKDGWYEVKLTVVKGGEVKVFSNTILINSKTGDGDVSTLECDRTKIKSDFGSYGTVKYGETIHLPQDPDPISGPDLKLLAPVVIPEANENLKYSWSGGAFAGGNNIKVSLGEGSHYYRLIINSTKNNGVSTPKFCYEFEYHVKIGSGVTTRTDETENRFREDRGDINVYPNPVSESVNIDISNAPIGPLFINISDSQGRQVTKKVIKQ